MDSTGILKTWEDNSFLLTSLDNYPVHLTLWDYINFTIYHLLFKFWFQEFSCADHHLPFDL